MTFQVGILLETSPNPFSPAMLLDPQSYSSILCQKTICIINTIVIISSICFDKINIVNGAPSHLPLIVVQVNCLNIQFLLTVVQ